MRRHPGGFLAMEEVAAAAAAADPVAPEEVIGENAESVETDLIEIAEDVAEQQEAEANVEEAGEVVEALESLYDKMDIAAKNGGMDKIAASMATEHLHYLYDQVGVRGSKMPSLESFGGTSSRISQTKLAMEDIKEKAKELWKKIVGYFERAIQWAVDFFNKIFGAWEKLEKRAAKLQKAAEGMKGEAKEKTFESESLMGKLFVGTGAPNVEATLGKFSALVKSLATRNNVGQVDEIVKGLEASDAGEKYIEKFTAKTNSEMVAGLTKVEGDKAKVYGAVKEGVAVFVGEALFGGKALVAKAVAGDLTGEAAIEARCSETQGMGDSVGAKKPAQSKLNVLELAKALEVTKAVSEVATEGLAYRNSIKKIEEAKKKLLAAAKKLETASSKSDDAEVRKNQNAQVKVAMHYSKTMDQPGASISVYALNTSKALLDLVEVSLKQYK